MICIYLADGFEEIEAISVVDILRRAELDIRMVSIMGRLEVKGSHGISVVADMVYEDVAADAVEMMILPGGMQGTHGMEAHAGLTAQLTAAAAQGKWLAAICAAPMILGRLGLLAGKAAMCYPGNEEHLRGAKLNYKDRAVVDGKVITSRGPGTSFDFALAIVSMLKGEAAAAQIKQTMLI